MRQLAPTFATSLAMSLALSGQAVALTCAPPDPLRSFQQAFDAEAEFLVVHGQIAFDPASLPQTSDGTKMPKSGSAPARFTGMGLTRDGFTTPLSMSLRLDVECLGPWCGGIDPERPQLAFLERHFSGYRLALSPCPGMAFEAPDPALLDRITLCLTEGGC